MIVLTGGAGFIGSAFLKKLNDEGVDDIIVVDNLGSSEKWKNLNGKKFTDFFEKSAFLEFVQNNGLPDDLTAVIHLGACSSTTETDANYMMANNFEYSKILATNCMQNEIRFIYASSAATYGDGSEGFSDDDDVTEKLHALNAYAFSKLAFDKWAIKSGAVYHITGLRYFNVFGPNEYHKEDMMSVVLKAYRQIKETGSVKLFKSYHPDYKDGEQKRDFVYVKDCSDVLWWMFDQEELPGIFNIGTGNARTWNDLATSIFSALKLKPKIEYIEMPETLRPKYQYFTEADMDSLTQEGCPHKFTTMEKAVKDYVQNYLEKGNGYL